MKRDTKQAERPRGASTRAVHAGSPASTSGQPVVTPIMVEAVRAKLQHALGAAK